MRNSVRPSTRDAILEAGFRILSKEPGASLARIAETAGVGRATLHRHFASREELLHTLALQAIAEMDEAIETACADAPGYSDALRRSLAVLIPLGDRHGFLALEPVDDAPEVISAFERQARETRDLVEAAKREGLFDRAVPSSWIVQAIDHLIYAGWESLRAGELTHSQASDLAWRTLTSGLGGQNHER